MAGSLQEVALYTTTERPKRHRKNSFNGRHSLLLNTNKIRRRNNTTFSKESHWACLPEDLLVLILDRLVTLSDYVRFSAVCRPWHAVALENYYGERRLKLSLHQPPLLFLTHTHPSKGETTIGIHCVSQNKTYELKSFLPRGSKRWFGSSHGWLITVDKNFVITLSNPFCFDGIIYLPPVLHRNGLHIHKVILSADPIVAPDDYTVMVIYIDGLAPDELAFIRPGDKGWTYIESGPVTDVIYSKVTKEFKVFKLLVLNGKKKWVETKELNVLADGALFLDDSTSTYVPASDILGCHPNSIYFVDHWVPGYAHPADVRPSTPCDMGIFHLRDGSFQWHCVSKFLSSPESMSLPIWIQPTFRGKRA
ncbi:uncharacterized protein LOC133880612 isoform X2 [Alnus glutinosa]|uniref:uncharacterized protein LOC133880612 isoform X2 n=1 Tax=Alnus glutinosa TaxID=3517 RepID=UPI002D76BEB1|nr:uncharacterized protein LOC133880612 isoform X2 [Alnus glutinosa]